MPLPVSGQPESGCHGGHKIFGIKEKWRGGRDFSQPFVSSPHLTDFIQLIELPAFQSKSFVHQKYITEGLSIAQVASKCKVSKEAVRKALKQVNPFIPDFLLKKNV